jgi:hypothetical protein
MLQAALKLKSSELEHTRMEAVVLKMKVQQLRHTLSQPLSNPDVVKVLKVRPAATRSHSATHTTGSEQRGCSH